MTITGDPGFSSGSINQSHWIPAFAGKTVRNRAFATHPLRAMAPSFLVAVPGEDFSTCGPAGRLRWHGSLGRRLPIAYLQPAFRQSSPASPRREDSRSRSFRSAKPGVGQPLAPIGVDSRTNAIAPFRITLGLLEGNSLLSRYSAEFFKVVLIFYRAIIPKYSVFRKHLLNSSSRRIVGTSATFRRHIILRSTAGSGDGFQDSS